MLSIFLNGDHFSGAKIDSQLDFGKNMNQFTSHQLKNLPRSEITLRMQIG